MYIIDLLLRLLRWMPCRYGHYLSSLPSWIRNTEQVAGRMIYRGVDVSMSGMDEVSIEKRTLLAVGFLCIVPGSVERGRSTRSPTVPVSSSSPT